MLPAPTELIELTSTIRSRCPREFSRVVSPLIQQAKTRNRSGVARFDYFRMVGYLQQTVQFEQQQR
jgi:aspartyl/asparaginyl-tRNA synthetase